MKEKIKALKMKKKAIGTFSEDDVWYEYKSTVSTAVLKDPIFKSIANKFYLCWWLT